MNNQDFTYSIVLKKIRRIHIICINTLIQQHEYITVSLFSSIHVQVSTSQNLFMLYRKENITIGMMYRAPPYNYKYIYIIITMKKNTIWTYDGISPWNFLVAFSDHPCIKKYECFTLTYTFINLSFWQKNTPRYHKSIFR